MAFMQCQIRSNTLDINVSVNVIYPEHVSKDIEVKVLYLLHGYKGHFMDWMSQTSIERYATEHQICVVMPSANNSYYANNVAGVNYFDFIALELPEIIENMFKVSKKNEDRFICGLSMGGYGALKVGLTYPNRYDKIASLSGALEIDKLYEDNIDNPKSKLFINAFGKMPIKGTKHDIYYLLDQIKDKKKVPDLFIACGTSDQFYEDYLNLNNFLDLKGITYTKKERDGGHEWRLWDLFIQDVLLWIFEKK